MLAFLFVYSPLIMVLGMLSVVGLLGSGWVQARRKRGVPPNPRYVQTFYSALVTSLVGFCFLAMLSTGLILPSLKLAVHGYALTFLVCCVASYLAVRWKKKQEAA